MVPPPASRRQRNDALHLENGEGERKRKDGRIKVSAIFVIRLHTKCTTALPSINDVSREMRGVWPNSELRKGGCVDLLMTRGGGPNFQIFADVIYELPLHSKNVNA